MQGDDFYKKIIDTLSDGVFFIDRSCTITFWNKGAEKMTGYSAEQVIRRDCRHNPMDLLTAEGLEFCLGDCPLLQVMQDGHDREAEVFVRHTRGHRVPMILRAAPIQEDDGEIIGVVVSFNKNNRLAMDTRLEMRELQRESITDPLTGVGNRKYLEGRLSAVIAEFENNARSAGLLFMDADHFKRVNDLHGHMTGDDVLRMIARTLLYTVRTTDTVGRWGGEEFVTILYDVSDVETLRATAEKLRTQVEHSRLNRSGLSVTISIGGTLLQPGDTIDSFIKRADALMYESKQAGRNRVTIA
jgi:diguanylate cyclase (GGDEF)-like protein/PAS domain S-box-containing protein